jgi:hypothetical protein
LPSKPLWLLRPPRKRLLLLQPSRRHLQLLRLLLPLLLKKRQPQPRLSLRKHLCLPNRL